MDAFLCACEPGWEPLVKSEIRASFRSPHLRSYGPGWVMGMVHDLPAQPCVAFARQIVPNPAPFSAVSINEWATLIFERLLVALAEHDGPWRLHIFCIPTPDSTAGPRRCALIREALLGLLKRKQKRLLKTLVTDDAAATTDNERLVQAVLFQADQGCIAIAGPAERDVWRHSLSPYAGGIVDIREDPRAPSRAYRKLLEAERQMQMEIQSGERCVDLGASPGGWSYIADARRAQVIAVDRSPLRDDLMASPLVTFVRGDAFRFAPETPVDWLLCDVISKPQRTLELLHDWLTPLRCRRFIVTMKFQGDEDYGCLAELKSLLAARSSTWMVKRLVNNKHEVTAMGMLPVDDLVERAPA